MAAGSNTNNIDQTIHHFSHQHPLELTRFPQPPPLSSPCSGCNLQVIGWAYTCDTCNYVLHTSCSKMPRRITHPSDPNHPLTLFSSPAYPEGVFSCNACGREGEGFSYHCDECELDVHILCTAMKLVVIHGSHHHPLNLCFSHPYPTQEFMCDICKSAGSKHWLYRCNRCNFDAHLGCALSPAGTVRPSAPPLPPWQSTVPPETGEIGGLAERVMETVAENIGQVVGMAVAQQLTSDGSSP